VTELVSDGQTAYEDQRFEGLALGGETISFKEFEGCTFARCSFLETTFRNCRFVDCAFHDCDLSLVRVQGCSFSNTKFEDSQLVGVNWTEASWPKRGLLRAIGFSRCALSHSTFLGLTLQQVTMAHCIAHDVDFAEADLSEADCRYTDFAGSRFLHTDLTGADFTGATEYAINASLNALKGAKFSLPEAMALLYGLEVVLTE
jgi:uncharacterized protein YjbI with pentapeptide repeats